jgi:hypothetical protein
MTIEIRRYTCSSKAQWNDLVAKSRNGTFLFLRDYMDYHADRFTDYSLMAYDGTELAAVLPANIMGSSVCSHGGLTYGGWVFDDRMKAPVMLDIFRAMIAFMKLQGSVRTILYKAVPKIYHRQPSDEDLYALHRLGATLVRRDIATAVNLSAPLPFGSQRKRNLKKAEKCGVRVLESDDLAGYHNLLADVLARHGATPVHSLEEIQLLKSRFPENIRLFGGFVDQRLMAGTIVFDTGRVAHTQYLASSDEGRDIGALDAVLASLSTEIFKGREYLSFGISTEDGGHVLNEGLISQKEGFGGRSFVHDFYELDI